MVERFLLSGRGLPGVARYALAAIVVVAAIAARLALPVAGLSFLFTFPTLMLVAFGLGRGPGWFGVGLSTGLSSLLLLDPSFGFAVSRSGWVAILLFAPLAAGLVTVCDMLAVRLLWRDADLAKLAASRAALAESEAFLRSVLGSSADCIKVLDLQANLIFLSEGGHSALEVTDFEAVKGRYWPDLWPGAGHAEAEAAVATARSGGKARFGGMAPTVAGTSKYWDVQVTPILGADGRPEKLLVVSRDITPAYESEASLRRSEERLRMQTEFLDTLIRQAPIGISITDAASGSVELNERAREMLGHDRMTAAIDRYEQFGAVHADGRPYARDDYPTMRALRDGVVIEREEMLYRRGGADGTGLQPSRWEVSSTPVRDAQGRVAAVMTVFFDVEEQRRAADILRDLNETLERRVAAEMAQRAEVEEALRQSQKMEAVGQLTGGLAHDFNNLLTGVIGSMELLSTRVAQGRLKDVDRYIIAAQGAAKRAASLTHRLLAFSRRQTLDPKPTDTNRLIAGIEELIRRTVGPQIAVDVIGAADLWPVLVDPPQLENALLNLCINARDAMPAGGRITIETANRWLDEHAAEARDLAPGKYISLCVTDTGTGIPPDVITRIFDPFFTTKPPGQGTGLGLSMIYGFVRQSGGQVRVYSELGRGTTMCLYLPRHAGERVEEAGDIDGSPAGRKAVGGTVLVVDDEATVRMLVMDVLDDLGFATLEAADGKAGLAILRSDVAVDLLVTDVGLPGELDGWRLAQAAREVRPNLKILFITGYAEKARTGALLPGSQVLTKPFGMRELAGRVEEMISPATI